MSFRNCMRDGNRLRAVEKPFAPCKQIAYMAQKVSLSLLSQPNGSLYRNDIVKYVILPNVNKKLFPYFSTSRDMTIF